MQSNARDEILNQFQSWSLSEQLDLLDSLVTVMRQQEKPKPKPRASILDFEGIGRGTWDDVGGIDEFLKQERASWDG